MTLWQDRSHSAQRVAALEAHLIGLQSEHDAALRLAIGSDGFIKSAIDYAACELHDALGKLEGERARAQDEYGYTYHPADDVRGARAVLARANARLAAPPPVPSLAAWRRGQLKAAAE